MLHHFFVTMIIQGIAEFARSLGDGWCLRDKRDIRSDTMIFGCLLVKDLESHIEIGIMGSWV